MLKFGFVGCGRIAQRYGELLGQGQIAGAKLVAVCDNQADRAKTFGEKYKVPFFKDMHEMMNAEDIDVVCVLTPSGHHPENVVALASHGKHILVEKPMALNVMDADRMIQACDKNGVRLFVVKQNRFNVPVVKLKEALDQGRFGRLTMGTVRVRWRRDQAYYDQDSWRGTWEHDGGVFTNQASHHLDLLIYLLGDVESVFAKSDTFLVDIETEDTGVAILKFTSGALGIVEATTAARPKNLEGSLSLLGEKGTVEIGGFAVNEIRHWLFEEERDSDNEVREKFSTNPPDVYGFGHKTYLEHVVHCLENDNSLLVDGLEGRRSLEVLNAIYESIETGKEVFLRFRPKHARLGQKS